jgi:hypothetical protein
MAQRETTDGFVDLAMIELEAHEDAYKPSFSVCKYLLETTKDRLGEGDHSWSHVAKHIADVRSTLPPHVRTDCDHFVKHNKEDIMTNFLQIGVSTQGSNEDDVAKIAAKQAQQEQAVAEQKEKEAEAASSNQGGGSSTESASEQAARYWEEKGQYCGACLTMTKKLSKWMQMACTQSVVVDRLMRMCGTMPPELADMCKSQKLWIAEYIIQKIAEQFPLPNHCAYIGLCEKTAVIMSLQNPLIRADNQNELMEELEGTNGKRQEGESVLAKAYKTPNSVPEITFDVNGGGVQYADVSKSQGVGLPSFYIDGNDAPRMPDPLALIELAVNASEPVIKSLIPSLAEAQDPLSKYTTSLLEVESTTSGFGGFDTTNPDDPEVQLHAQNAKDVSVPIMHAHLKKNHGHTIADVEDKTQFNMLKDFQLESLKTTIPKEYLKGCGACQFTIGAMYEFLANARTIRALLPAVKKACSSCNSAEEIAKCEALVETHGVAFYQDVLRQASPYKWCPRLDLCEINYFIPSPHVLPDTYASVKEQVTKVSDF